ncbi:hypothetical protein JI435_417080, partial [Parastagonospora nodorum SN15]
AGRIERPLAHELNRAISLQQDHLTCEDFFILMTSSMARLRGNWQRFWAFALTRQRRLAGRNDRCTMPWLPQPLGVRNGRCWSRTELRCRLHITQMAALLTCTRGAVWGQSKLRRWQNVVDIWNPSIMIG